MLPKSGVNHGGHGYFPLRPNHEMEGKLEPDGAKRAQSTENVEEAKETLTKVRTYD
jgi:hypothetical protein